MKVTKYRVNGKGSYLTLEEAAAVANRIFQRYGVIVEVTTYTGRMDRTEWLPRGMLLNVRRARVGQRQSFIRAKRYPRFSWATYRWIKHHLRAALACVCNRQGDAEAT